MKRHIPQQKFIIKNERKNEIKKTIKPSVIVVIGSLLNVKRNANITIFKIIKEVQYSFLLKVSFDHPNSMKPLQNS